MSYSQSSFVWAGGRFTSSTFAPRPPFSELLCRRRHARSGHHWFFFLLARFVIASGERFERGIWDQYALADSTDRQGPTRDQILDGTNRDSEQDRGVTFRDENWFQRSRVFHARNLSQARATRPRGEERNF